MDEKQPEGLAEIRKALGENRALALLASQVEGLRNTVLSEINVLDKALTDVTQRLESLEGGVDVVEAFENAQLDITVGDNKPPQPIRAGAIDADLSTPAPEGVSRAMLHNLIMQPRFKSLKRVDADPRLPSGGWRALIWKTRDYIVNKDKPHQIQGAHLEDVVHQCWQFLGGHDI